MPKLPDRWLDYKNIGDIIPGTRFITFKVPLQKNFFYRVPEETWFTPSDLIQSTQDNKLNVGLVIDLTFTNKYYNPKEFTDQGVQYEKIFVPGHVIPSQEILDKFYETVDNFLENSDEDSLVGVHCTHGVNRTGYVVCRYMVDRLGIKASDALSAYGTARGYPVERGNYIHDLKVRSGEATGEYVPPDDEKSGKKHDKGHGHKNENNKVDKDHNSSEHSGRHNHQGHGGQHNHQGPRGQHNHQGQGPRGQHNHQSHRGQHNHQGQGPRGQHNHQSHRGQHNHQSHRGQHNHQGHRGHHHGNQSQHQRNQGYDDDRGQMTRRGYYDSSYDQCTDYSGWGSSGSQWGDWSGGWGASAGWGAPASYGRRQDDSYSRSYNDRRVRSADSGNSYCDKDRQSDNSYRSSNSSRHYRRENSDPYHKH